MHVCHLEIENFRGIRTASIPLRPHTVLLGPNNVGKSTIVAALSLLLGRDRLVRTLGDYDFYGGCPKAVDRIRLRATLTGFSSNRPEDLPQWFNERAAATPIWWDDATETVVEKSGPNRQLAFQIGLAARFDEDILEVETIRYFVDGDGDPFEDSSIVTVKGAHLTELGFFLLPASRTWSRVVSFGSELFRRVLRFQDAIPGPAITRLRDWLRSPTENIETVSPFAEIVSRVNTELAAFVGAEGAGLTFRPTSGDIEGVLEALIPHLLGREGVALPVERHGSGVVSLQTLLLLLEFAGVRHRKGENFILAAEEPELHLHPGHHRHLVSRIRSVSTQSLLTTHSPEIAAYFSPGEIRILSATSNGTLTARPLSKSMPTENALMRLLTLYRGDLCSALMHRVVLVPEGLTEARWFNGLLRACSGSAEADLAKESTPSRTVGFGVVPTQDAKVVRTFEMLVGSAPFVVPLVDGDSAGDGYAKELVQKGATFIVQLQRGAALEALIASFISSSGGEDTDWASLEEALGDSLPSHTVQSLEEYLVTNKKRWDIHETIVAWIAEHPQSRRRAVEFLEAITRLPEIIDKPGWYRDGNQQPVVQWQWSEAPKTQDNAH